MKTFKQIYKEVEKALRSTPEPQLYPKSDKVRVEYINRAMEEWFSVCTLCHKKMKNYRGVILHTAKVHRETYLLARAQRHALLSPSRGEIHVKWSSPPPSKKE